MKGISNMMLKFPSQLVELSVQGKLFFDRLRRRRKLLFPVTRFGWKHDSNSNQIGLTGLQHAVDLLISLYRIPRKNTYIGLIIKKTS